MSERARHLYLVALGSNMRVPGIGAPRAVLRAAFAHLERGKLDLLAASPIVDSRPVGPSARRYANAAALVATGLGPPEMLDALQAIEQRFGRTRRGRRWRARTLDLDIALWSGGTWHSPRLTIPHPALQDRAFVLTPAAALAPRWRHPASGHSLAQLKARLTRPRPLLR